MKIPIYYKSLLFKITINKWKKKWNQKKINLNIYLNIELFNYVLHNKTIMQCLFEEVHQSYISSNMLPYQTTEVFKYSCLIEFVYAYHQVNTSLATTGISIQKVIINAKNTRSFLSEVLTLYGLGFFGHSKPGE